MYFFHIHYIQPSPILPKHFTPFKSPHFITLFLPSTHISQTNFPLPSPTLISSSFSILSTPFMIYLTIHLQNFINLFSHNPALSLPFFYASVSFTQLFPLIPHFSPPHFTPSHSFTFHPTFLDPPTLFVYPPPLFPYPNLLFPFLP